MGCVCSSLWGIGNSFHIKSSVSLSSISGFPGGNSELCSTLKSCGSILSGTKMVDSGEDIFVGSSMPFLLTGSISVYS